jgi:hypothetical protein
MGGPVRSPTLSASFLMKIDPQASAPSESPGEYPEAILTAPPAQSMLARITTFLKGKETMLWWAHSAWALLFGFGVMWLGSRNFTYLRIIFFHIGFIWLSSLFLPVFVNRSWFSSVGRERIRMMVNYFNKNFYQQLLFFLLPIYYSSTTMGSRNMVFLMLLAASAVLSTLDIIYDRYLSVRWQLTALFFAFNLFASINVMLPVLWAVNHSWSLWISAILALLGFDSMLYRLSGLHGRFANMLRIAAGIGLLAIITIFQPFIPPAPLSLVNAQFGSSVRALEIVNPLTVIPASPGKIAVMTSIKAPLGLEEGVRHRWYLGSKEIFASRIYSFQGGNRDGYRIWTQITWSKEMKREALTVDVETAEGQLIGRATLEK